MWKKTLSSASMVVGLVASASLFWPGCKGTDGTPPVGNADTGKPALSVFYAGNMWGELSPCG